MLNNTFRFIFEDTEYRVPGKRIICPRCNGEGVHDPEGFGDGFTGAEFAEMEAGDPDFRRNYFSGRFDVRCSECKGDKIVIGPDVERMNEEEWAAYEGSLRAENDAYWAGYYERLRGC